MIITQTPFRISFFGGGTDFPDFYNKYGGATLSATINKYSYIAVHRLLPVFKYRFRASYSQTELVQYPEEFKHPLIRECLLFLGVQDGLEISHSADLPGRTGIGSSSAFTVGLLHALHKLMRHQVDAATLAKEAIVVERERVGDLGGHQDQYAAAYGGFLRIDYSAGQQTAVRRINLPEARLRELSRRLMLFYTGVEKSAAEILARQTQSIAKNTAHLHTMREMALRAEEILTSHADLSALGALLHESWTLKKQLADGISNADIDAAYERARAAGATGGKLLGAGGRGFLLLDVPPARQADVIAALKELLLVRFNFTDSGSRVLLDESSP